ncbi:MAG: hypothetical protein U0894_11080 [Pirellulales bacterium]
MAAVISNLKNRVPNIDKAVISTHCHDDLGMAVANSENAVEAGAGQIECTINGIGERAGNCSLEEVVMAYELALTITTAPRAFRPSSLVPTSRLLASITGLQVPRNKGHCRAKRICSRVRHSPRWHAEEPSTYEIMRPEDVGFQKTDLVLRA